MIDTSWVVRQFADHIRIYRVLAGISVFSGLLFLLDAMASPVASQTNCVAEKSVSEKRVLIWKIRNHYLHLAGTDRKESAPPEVVEQLEIGDCLQVSISPIFHEWSEARLEREGGEVVSFQGVDLRIFPFFALALFATAVAFLPVTWWRRQEGNVFAMLLVSTVMVAHLIGVMTPLRVLLVQLGS